MIQEFALDHLQYLIHYHLTNALLGNRMIEQMFLPATVSMILEVWTFKPHDTEVSNNEHDKA